MTADRPPPGSPGRPPRVALVHDWLTGMRGGEKVLDALCEIYPEAPLYSLVHVPGSVSPRIESRPIRTAFTQRLPGAARFYRHYLPLFPTAVELFDLDGFDLIVSTSHCAVKSVVPPGRAVHVSYCHSPMRYAWDQFEAYFGRAQVGALRNRLLEPVMAALARWDRDTAGRVDSFVANSRYVAGRIRRYYNRGSTVVYPPVDTDFYRPADSSFPPRSGFLVVSALVPYKRLELAIDACRAAGAPLTVVGSGPELARLQARAGSGVSFLGWRSDEEVRDLYRRAEATLLPGVEDFGMVPVEAQACGCPVVAYAEGGAAETVIDDETGALVPTATAAAFADALTRVRGRTFDTFRLRDHALRFSRQQFLDGFRAAVNAAAHAKLGRASDGWSLPQRNAASEAPTNAASRTPSQQEAAREDRANAASWTPPQQKAAREDRTDAASRPSSQQEAAREDPEDAASCTPSQQKAAREDQQ